MRRLVAAAALACAALPAGTASADYRVICVEHYLDDVPPVAEICVPIVLEFQYHPCARGYVDQYIVGFPPTMDVCIPLDVPVETP